SERGGELAAAEEGRGETLASRDPSPELVSVFGDIFCHPVANRYLRADEVVDVAQAERVALLAVGCCIEAAAGPGPFAGSRGRLACADLVAEDRVIADGRENVEVLDVPVHLGLPEDGLEDTACG